MTDATSEATAPVPVALRRQRSSTGGHSLKLTAPNRAGFVRRFVLNDPSRILAMQEMGYDFVQDVATTGAKRTDGVGTRITRHAGRDEHGKPQQHILMECRQEDYAVGVAEKEDRLKPFEEAIRRGDDPSGGLSRAETYDPGGVRSTINNSGA